MLGRQRSLRFALVSLASIPMVVMACGGDDDGPSSNGNNSTGGSGGSSTTSGTGADGGSNGSGTTASTNGIGGSGGNGGNGGSGTVGSGGTGTGGSSSGGAQATGGSGNVGGTDSSGGSGNVGGSAGAGNSGGTGAEAGMGGEGGAPPEPMNLLENGDFEAFMADWENEPDTGLAFPEWAWEHQGISHWSNSEYSVSTYQTIEDVPDGTYSFSIYAISGGGFDDQYIYARGYNQSDTNEEVRASLNSVPSSGYTEANKVTLSGIVVTSGTVTVGFHSDSNSTADNAWANFDDAVFIME